MTWPEIRHPIYDLPLKSTSVSDLRFDNDEKVASSLKHMPLLRLEYKNGSLFMTKMAQIS